MSQSKPLTGAEVKGYRTLSDGEIEVMNRLKAASAHFINLLETSKETGADPRWCARARTAMQEACMFGCRAVAKPDDNS